VRRAATAASATAIPIFLTRYVIAPVLSLGRGLVDELNRSCAEIELVRRRAGLALDSVPDHLREIAGEGARVSACLEAVEVESDPADHVVGGVRALPGQRVVDGEEQHRPDPLLERVLDLGRVELRAGIGEVAADREVAV